jgi:hypothetical protein
MSAYMDEDSCLEQKLPFPFNVLQRMICVDLLLPMIPQNASVDVDTLRAPLLQQQSNESGVPTEGEHHSAIGITMARWWILVQYSLLTFNQVLPMRSLHFIFFTFTQGWFWDIPGPIFSSYMTTYNLSQDTLQVCSCNRTQIHSKRLLPPQLFVNYGSIFFLLSSLPIAFLLDRPNGMRVAVILSAACNFIGCVLRLLARSTSVYSVAFLHASYIVNAFGGPGHLPKSKSQLLYSNKTPQLPSPPPLSSPIHGFPPRSAASPPASPLPATPLASSSRMPSAQSSCWRPVSTA